MGIQKRPEWYDRVSVECFYCKESNMLRLESLSPGVWMCVDSRRCCHNLKEKDRTRKTF